MSGLTIGLHHIHATLGHLQDGGLRNCETAVLWLASYGAPGIVAEVYRPEQTVAQDFFHISRPAMRGLMAHLRAGRMSIVAQVHSHPGRAFHSAADDRWAIVRHEGALSIVLPEFARRVTPANFLAMSAVYRLSAANTWDAVSPTRLATEVGIARC